MKRVFVRLSVLSVLMVGAGTAEAQAPTVLSFAPPMAHPMELVVSSDDQILSFTDFGAESTISYSAADGTPAPVNSNAGIAQALGTAADGVYVGTIEPGSPLRIAVMSGTVYLWDVDLSVSCQYGSTSGRTTTMIGSGCPIEPDGSFKCGRTYCPLSGTGRYFEFTGQFLPDDTVAGTVHMVVAFGGGHCCDFDNAFSASLAEVPADVAVPAVARVQGSGAFFTSLMHLYNAGATDLEIEFVFTPREGSGGDVVAVNHTVPAGVLQTIEDPLETLFGFSGSAGRVGSLLITVTSGSADDLMAQTVVFARLDSGEEYGQYFPAMRFAQPIGGGRRAYLNTTEDPVVNRVNIGFMAVSESAYFRVTPVDPLGNGLASTDTFWLDEGENKQINNIHDTFGLGAVANVVMEVEVVFGFGLSYVSVLDGNTAYDGTSDPTTILPVFGGSDEVTLLEIGSIQGQNEFSGSASITNYSDFEATVRADFFQRGISGVTASESLSIPAGDTLGFTDLVGDLFGIFGDVGTVLLTTTNDAQIGATGREFAIFRDTQGEIVGTAGQLMAGQTDNDLLEPGRVYHFIGLRQANVGPLVERSHIAVCNANPEEAEITVRLYDGASGAYEGEKEWTVGRETLIQKNNVIRLINNQHDDGEKRVEVEVSQRVHMNAFRVNIWGDPVTLSPFSN